MISQSTKEASMDAVKETSMDNQPLQSKGSFDFPAVNKIYKYIK